MCGAELVDGQTIAALVAVLTAAVALLRAQQARRAVTRQLPLDFTADDGDLLEHAFPPPLTLRRRFSAAARALKNG